MSEIVFGWPEWIVLVWLSLYLIVRIAYDGKPRNQNYSLPWGIIDAATWMTLLYFGGFFTGPNP